MSSARRAGMRHFIRLGAATSALCAATCFAENADAEVDPAPPGESATGSAESEPSARHGSVFVDPLGLLLFGPRVGLEVGAGHLSIAAHVRWFNAGLLAHSLFLNPGDSFGFSYGGGLRARYYLGDDLAGSHLGIAAEYLHTRIENSDAEVATTSSYFVPYAEVGYRLPFGSFYADGSAGAGYAARLSGSVENLPGGSSADLYRAQDKSSVYGTASLDFGIFF